MADGVADFAVAVDTRNSRRRLQTRTVVIENETLAAGRRRRAVQHQWSDGMLMFKTAPDYEMPMDMGGDNMYMVTVMADYGHGDTW